MSESSNWLVHDHRKYEATLEECELAAGAGEWKEAVQLYHSFADELKVHMLMEDEVLYPAFMEEVDNSADIIADLSDEHEQIVRLLHDLSYVIKRNDMDHFEESLLPLYKALTQHNNHEEEVFSKLENHPLLMRREEIMARLKSLGTAHGLQGWDV